MAQAFWYLNDKKFYNKRQFLLERPTSDDNFGFTFGGYEKYDWSTTVETEWRDLLKKRALEIRNNSKKLRLWYTGGADTQTILNVFLENDIYLDEIIVGMQQGVGNEKQNLLWDSEQHLVALPFLEKNKNKLSKTKIRFATFSTEEFIEYYNDFETGWSDCLVNVPHVTMPPMHAVLRESLEPEFTEITGDQKYDIGMDNTGFYTTVTDSSYYHVFDPDKKRVEMFFMHPDIWSKQCKMVLEYAKNTGIYDFVKKFSTDRNFKTCHTHAITDYLTRDKLPYPFSLGKFPETAFFDFWKFSNMSPNKLKKYLECFGFDSYKSSMLSGNLHNHCILGIKTMYELNYGDLGVAYFNAIDRLDKKFEEKNLQNWLYDSYSVTSYIKGIESERYYLDYHTDNKKQQLQEQFNVQNLESAFK